jgi:hypothetical protein
VDPATTPGRVGHGCDRLSSTLPSGRLLLLVPRTTGMAHPGYVTSPDRVM